MGDAGGTAGIGKHPGYGARQANAFIGAAQQHCHQARLIEQARRAQPFDQPAVIVVIGGDRSGRQSGAKGIGDVGDQAVEHGGHQRPLLLGQALRGIEEKIDANRGQPVASRGSRGRVLVGCGGSDRPFFRHHQRRLIEFLLTSRQLEA